MNFFSKKNHTAFTLVESLAYLGIIGIIVTFTFISTIQIDKNSESFVVTQTETFYNNASAIYQKIILNNTSDSANINKLKDVNNDNKIDSIDLRDYFVNYFGKLPKDCAAFNIKNQQILNYLDNAACAELSSGINAAFYLNTECNTRIDNVKPYAVLKNYSVSKTENACGYIVYYPKKAKELTIGKSVFIIPLGKMFFK